MKKKEADAVRPILKWAGGKGSLIAQMEPFLPPEIYDDSIETYIEPFVGGGSFLFHLTQKFSFKKVVILDINPELIILYKAIKNNAAKLITALTALKDLYYKASDRVEFYYERRDEYNSYDKNIDANRYSEEFIYRAALTVFLNKTCFNGLYRVNRLGHFNVPVGSYKNPVIFDKNNVLQLSALLQPVHIVHGDFSCAREFCGSSSFIYYDPPYRPIKRTSSFNAYSHEEFGDAEQIRLKELFDELSQKGAKQMLSNSDPRNYSEDNFFDDLYSAYNINRILAKRRINAQGNGRGAIRELLITNYDGKKEL